MAISAELSRTPPKPVGHQWETQGDSLKISTRVGAFLYVLVIDISRPAPAPVELRISLDPDHGDESLTFETIQATPLRGLLSVAEGAMASVLQGRYMAWLVDLPKRIQNDRDYARLAAVYVKAVEDGHPDPVARLARAMKISPNTLHARLRRVRDLGLVEGGLHGTPAKLTRKAKRLLEEGQK